MRGTSCPHISTSRFFVPTQTYLRLHFLAHLGTAVWNKVPSLPAPERLASKPRCRRAVRTQLTLGPLWVLADRMGQEACIFDLLPLASLSAQTLGDWFPSLCGPNSRLNSASRCYPYRRCCHISSRVQTNITMASARFMKTLGPSHEVTSPGHVIIPDVFCAIFLFFQSLRSQTRPTKFQNFYRLTPSPGMNRSYQILLCS